MEINQTHINAVRRIVAIRGNKTYYEDACVRVCKNSVLIVVYIKDEFYRDGMNWMAGQWRNLFEKYISRDIYYEITINSNVVAYDLLCQFGYDK